MKLLMLPCTCTNRRFFVTDNAPVLFRFHARRRRQSRFLSATRFASWEGIGGGQATCLVGVPLHPLVSINRAELHLGTWQHSKDPAEPAEPEGDLNPDVA